MLLTLIAIFVWCCVAARWRSPNLSVNLSAKLDFGQSTRSTLKKYSSNIL